MSDDDNDDEEEKILEPEEILALLHSEERALARIVDSPDPRRLAVYIEGTLVAILKESLRTMASQQAAIEELEATVYVRSTLQHHDAQKIHTLLDKTMSLYESGAKDMLPLSERDAFAALLGEVRRLTVRAEEDEPEDDDDEDDDAAVANAPEIQPAPNGQP